MLDELTGVMLVVAFLSSFVIPLIVGLMFFSYVIKEQSNKIITMAAFLTLKPVIFISLGFICWLFSWSTLPLTGLAAATSMVIAVVYIGLLYDQPTIRDIALFVVLDVVRVFINISLTVSFDYYNTPFFIVFLVSLSHTVFAIVAFMIVAKEIESSKLKRI